MKHAQLLFELELYHPFSSTSTWLQVHLSLPYPTLALSDIDMVQSSVGFLGELPPAPQKMSQDLSLQVSFIACRYLCSCHQKIHSLLSSLPDITLHSNLFYFQNHLLATLASPFLWPNSSLWARGWPDLLLEGISGSSSPMSIVDLSCTCKPLDTVGSFLLVLEVTSFHPFTSPDVVLTLGLGVDTVHPFISSYPYLTQQVSLSFSEVSQPLSLILDLVTGRPRISLSRTVTSAATSVNCAHESSHSRNHWNRAG